MYLKPEPYIDLAEAPSYEASFKLSDHVTFFYYLLSGLLYQYMLFIHGYSYKCAALRFLPAHQALCCFQ